MRLRRKIAGVGLGLLLWMSCSSSVPEPESAEAVPPESASVVEAKLVPLPEIEWEELSKDAQEKIRSVYDPAIASPDDAEVVGMLGMMLHAHTRYEQAMQCYQRARALAPEEFRWLYYQGIVTDNLGDRPAAIALVRQATEVAPGYAPARVRLADLLLETGELVESEKSCRKAIEIDPKLASAHLSLGKLLAARRQWKEAVSAYEEAVRLEADYAPAHYALGLAYRQVGQTDKAQDALRRYQQVKDMALPSFDPEFEAIAAALDLTDAPERPSLDIPTSGLQTVAAELETALKAQPQMLSAHQTLIGVYWELRQPEKSEQHYRAALKLKPRDALTHYNWGLVQMLRGDLAAAAGAFDEALEIDPEYADAMVQYGLLNERRGAPGEAVRYYRSALQVNPDHRRAHYRLGIKMFEQGNPEEGLRHFHETIKIRDRETPRFMLLLARAYGHLGKPERAAHYFDESRKLAAALGMDELAAQLDAERAQMPGAKANP